MKAELHCRKKKKHCLAHHLLKPHLHPIRSGKKNILEHDGIKWHAIKRCWWLYLSTFSLHCGWRARWQKKTVSLYVSEGWELNLAICSDVESLRVNISTSYGINKACSACLQSDNAQHIICLPPGLNPVEHCTPQIIRRVVSTSYLRGVT